MPSIGEPTIGAIAFGSSGRGYPITRLEGKSAVLRTESGLLRVPVSSIQRLELPLEPPASIQVGDTVRLRGTDRSYAVIRLYSVYMGQDEHEDWAELEGPSGTAYWKVEQLE